MKANLAALAILASLALVGCRSMEDVDRSNVNHAAMDLRKPVDLGEPSPSTGLRKLRSTGGTESCPTCAH